MNKIFFLVFLIALIGTSAAIDSKCLLPKEAGPCRAMKYRYAYNPTTSSCEQFVYGGCQGNDNNFGTDELCKAACS